MDLPPLGGYSRTKFGHKRDENEMKASEALADDKKLCVIYRMEPGCLGPNGADHISDFCDFACKTLKSFNSHFVLWRVQPRNDKSLPEIEYRINNKILSRDKADRYLAIMGEVIEEFEIHIHEDMSDMIEDYFSRS